MLHKHVSVLLHWNAFPHFNFKKKAVVELSPHSWFADQW